MAKDLFDQKGDKPPVAVKNEDGSFTIGDKTYKDDNALMESKVHADRHINVLTNEKRVVETELTQAQENYKKVSSVEGKIDMLIEQGQSAEVLKEFNDLEGGNVEQNTATAQSPDIAAIVAYAVAQVQKTVQPLADKLAQYEEKATIDNFSAMVEKTYGEKGEEAISQFAEKAGLTMAEVKGMVKDSPVSTFKLLTMTVTKPGDTAPNPANIPGNTDVSGTGVPNVNRTGTDNTFKPQKGFKELRNKMKMMPHQWKVEDQNALNEGFEKLGEDFSLT